MQNTTKLFFFLCYCVSQTGRFAVFLYLSFSDVQFSTNDNDNDDWDNSCAQTHKGAWWYRDCLGANLNGFYLNGSHSSYADGVNWAAFRGVNYSLKYTQMNVKIKS